MFLFSTMTPAAETNSPTAGLDKIVIPEVDFRDAAMSDVVTFLAMNSVPLGQPSPRIEQTVTRSNTTYVIKWTENKDKDYSLVPAGPGITLKASHISLLELFKAVTLLADGKIKIRNNKITIETKNVLPPKTVPVNNKPLPDPF